jgi:hypothetical protein
MLLLKSHIFHFLFAQINKALKNQFCTICLKEILLELFLVKMIKIGYLRNALRCQSAELRICFTNLKTFTLHMSLLPLSALLLPVP